MRKKLTILIACVFALVMCLAMSTVTASAKADKAVYGYRVMLYAGQQGHFTKAAGGKLSKGGKVWSKEYAAGAQVSITEKTLGFVIDNDKYYSRGFRIAGHDNDEVSGYKQLSFKAGEDVSYEIAYGIKGALVEYTIEYVDENGDELADSDVYYGMAGDKPVVSYRYIEGYLPDAYNKGKKLSKDPSENVFTFTYHQIDTDDNGGQGNQGGQGGQGGNQGGQGNQGGNANAPGTAANPAGTNIAPAQTPTTNPGQDGQDGQDGNTTIDDGNTPTTDPGQYDDLDDDDTPTGVPGQEDGDQSFFGKWLPYIIGLIVLLLALIAAIALKKKNKKDSEGSDAENNA